MKFSNLLYTFLYSPSDFRELFLFRFYKLKKKCGLCTVRKPFLTIIIPTYGRENILINRTIPSILNQSDPDFQCIIVTDGPEPDKIKKIEAIKNNQIIIKESKIRPNYPSDSLKRWMVQGYRARNLGLSNAKGEWILWMSDDDILKSNCVSDFKSFVKTHPDCDLIMASIEKESETGWEVISVSNPSTRISGRPVIGVPGAIHHWSLRHRWRRLTHWKSWNKPNDYDLYERFIRHGAQIAYCESIVGQIPFADKAKKLHGSRYWLEMEGNSVQFP